MSIKAGDTVTLKRDIYRFVDGEERLYASANKTGKVIETFVSGTGAKERIWYAKVQMDDQIKSFRLTSLAKV